MLAAPHFKTAACLAHLSQACVGEQRMHTPQVDIRCWQAGPAPAHLGQACVGEHADLIDDVIPVAWRPHLHSTTHA
jgi:hypothetical protein